MDRVALEWIERYSTEVGRMLPAARRKDIELEIRSLLMDEAEGGAGGGPVSESDVLALLERYPSPERMAARYGAPRYLIGPALYPTYLTVARLVAVIITVVVVVGVLLSAFTNGVEGFGSLSGMVGGYVESLLTSLGVVTLIFALVERGGQAATRAAPEVQGWKPSALPRLGEGEHVSVTDMITGIVTSLVTILWLNLYVNGDGTLAIFANEPITMAIFSPRFLAFIPWVTAIWVGELAVQIVVLARRRWERGTRLAMVAFGLLGTAALALMLGGGALGANPTVEPWVDGFVAVALLVTLIELVGHLRALLRGRGMVPALPTSATVA